MKPATYRGSSAILMENKNKFLLLDCAEGSYGQIFDCFGREGADRVIKNLLAVYITHIHGDHQIGLVKIMQEKAKLMEEGEKFYIIAPKGLLPWLIWHQNYNFPEKNFVFIKNCELNPEPELYYEEDKEKPFPERSEEEI